MDKHLLQYMSNPHRIKRTVEQFRKMKYQDFQPSGNGNDAFDWLYRLPLSDNPTDNPYNNPFINRADYLDLLCLLKHVCDHDINAAYITGRGRVNGLYFRLAVIRMIASKMQKLASSDTRIRMFLSLPVGPFFSYIKTICDEKRYFIQDPSCDKTNTDHNLMCCENHYKKCCEHNKKDAENLSNLCINEVFSLAFHMINRPWSPLISIQGYKERVIDSHKLVADILWEPFYAAWNERFIYNQMLRNLKPDFNRKEILK